MCLVLLLRLTDADRHRHTSSRPLAQEVSRRVRQPG